MYSYNPDHPIATCADCGGEMVHNVPRLGPDGGYVHKATGQLQCGQYVPPAVGPSLGAYTIHRPDRSADETNSTG